jgi:hypothetical protein
MEWPLKLVMAFAIFIVMGLILATLINNQFSEAGNAVKALVEL